MSTVPPNAKFKYNDKVTITRPGFYEKAEGNVVSVDYFWISDVTASICYIVLLKATGTEVKMDEKYLTQ